MNKIMPHSMYGKAKAIENQQSTSRGREAVEINSSIWKQCFRLLIYTCGSNKMKTVHLQI